METIWTIYVLKDPRNGEVRYVGKTTDEAWRETAHKSNHSKIGKPRISWVQELKEAGYEPVFEVVDRCTKEHSNKVELYWMMLYVAQGARLTNSRMPTGGKHTVKLTREHKQIVKQIAQERGMMENAVIWLVLEFVALHQFDDVLDEVFLSLSLPIS